MQMCVYVCGRRSDELSCDPSDDYNTMMTSGDESLMLDNDYYCWFAAAVDGDGDSDVVSLMDRSLCA